VRVALVHDYLNQMGGAEKVVEVFCEMFPHAPVYTSVYDPEAMPDFWRSVEVRTSFMQRFSPSLKVAKRLLPLYPAAFESFDLSQFDLVLSSCSTFAKGVITPPHTLHVCYCHNTTRFAWMYPEYIAHERLTRMQRYILKGMVTPLRTWDYVAAQRVDHYVANSRTTARRIAKFYRRSATVIEPPIRAAEFAGGDGVVEPYFLRCTALIVPGKEDFGLTALEVQAAGRPVIAYRAGGSLETVVDGTTGAFFREPTPEALAAALRCFDPAAFDPEQCREYARCFDVAVFRRRLAAHLDSVMAGHGDEPSRQAYPRSRAVSAASGDPGAQA
jgi:hypothetical protein